MQSVLQEKYRREKQINKELAIRLQHVREDASAAQLELETLRRARSEVPGVTAAAAAAATADASPLHSTAASLSTADAPTTSPSTELQHHQQVTEAALSLRRLLVSVATGRSLHDAVQCEAIARGQERIPQAVRTLIEDLGFEEALRIPRFIANGSTSVPLFDCFALCGPSNVAVLETVRRHWRQIATPPEHTAAAIAAATSASSSAGMPPRRASYSQLRPMPAPLSQPVQKSPVASAVLPLAGSGASPQILWQYLADAPLPSSGLSAFCYPEPPSIHLVPIPLATSDAAAAEAAASELVDSLFGRTRMRRGPQTHLFVLTGSDADDPDAVALAALAAAAGKHVPARTRYAMCVSVTEAYTRQQLFALAKWNRRGAAWAHAAPSADAIDPHFIVVRRVMCVVSRYPFFEAQRKVLEELAYAWRCAAIDRFRTAVAAGLAAVSRAYVPPPPPPPPAAAVLPRVPSAGLLRSPSPSRGRSPSPSPGPVASSPQPTDNGSARTSPKLSLPPLFTSSAAPTNNNSSSSVSLSSPSMSFSGFASLFDPNKWKQPMQQAQVQPQSQLQPSGGDDPRVLGIRRLSQSSMDSVLTDNSDESLHSISGGDSVLQALDDPMLLDDDAAAAASALEANIAPPLVLDVAAANFVLPVPQFGASIVLKEAPLLLSESSDSVLGDDSSSLDSAQSASPSSRCGTSTALSSRASVASPSLSLSPRLGAEATFRRQEFGALNAASSSKAAELVDSAAELLVWRLLDAALAPAPSAASPVGAHELGCDLTSEEAIAAITRYCAPILLSVLPLDSLLLLVGAALSEHKIVFVGQTLSHEVTSSCVMAMAALLRPLGWVGPFLPTLPSTLFEVLSAPVPILVGLQQLPSDFEQDEATVLVLLDRETVRIPAITARNKAQTMHIQQDDVHTLPAFLEMQLPGNSTLYHELYSVAASVRTSVANADGTPSRPRPCYRPTTVQTKACAQVVQAIQQHIKLLLCRFFGAGLYPKRDPQSQVQSQAQVYRASRLAPVMRCVDRLLERVPEVEGPFWTRFASSQLLSCFAEDVNQRLQLSLSSPSNAREFLSASASLTVQADAVAPRPQPASAVVEATAPHTAQAKAQSSSSRRGSVSRSNRGATSTSAATSSGTGRRAVPRVDLRQVSLGPAAAASAAVTNATRASTKRTAGGVQTVALLPRAPPQKETVKAPHIPASNPVAAATVGTPLPAISLALTEATVTTVSNTSPLSRTLSPTYVSSDSE